MRETMLPSPHEIETWRLGCQFQRIARLVDGEAFAWQAVFHGPPGSPLHSYQNIVKFAHDKELLPALDWHCMNLAIGEFARLGNPQKLFVDMSPASLNSYSAELAQLQVDSSNIVLNLVDPVGLIEEPLLLLCAARLKLRGFRICVDETWRGLNNPGSWEKLRPDYIQLGAHYMRHAPPGEESRSGLAAVKEWPRKFNAQIIITGIDTEKLLNAAHEAGMPYGQGALLGRPTKTANMKNLVDGSGLAVTYGIARRSGDATPSSTTVANLVQDMPAIAPNVSSSEVYEQFAGNPNLYMLPVVNGYRPIGLITRERIIDAFARPYSREIYGKKPCTIFMDFNPLIVDEDTTIQELSKLILSTERRHFSSGFIITHEAQYRGAATGHDLIREITHMQIAAARHANPLTQLPGNVAIQERISAMLESHTSFVACYADLDNFKPYNDIYGYAQGDRLIQLTASILQAHADGGADFIGHIGGDDFIVLFESKDWEERCQAILAVFDQAIPDFYTEQDRERHGCMAEDRRGLTVFYPLASLSLGIVHADGTEDITHHHIATAAAHAKKQAKKIAGSSLFIDRRKF